MKKLVQITAILFASVSFLTAADTPKYLTVDMGDLYSKYDKAIETQEKFKEAAEKAQAEINKMMKEGMELGEKYKQLQAKASNPALTEEAKNKFISEANEVGQQIEKKQIDITQYQQQTAETLNKRRESILALHLDEIKKVLTGIAEKRGADMVLNSTGMVVMYSKPEFDITEEAVKILNTKK